MRILLSFIVLFYMVNVSFATEDTIMDGEVESGYFGGPVFKVTEVNNELAFMIGGRGGWILNHKYAIGFGGYKMINEVNAHAETRIAYNSPNLRTSFEYMGLEFVNVIYSEKLIHYTFYSLTGLGNIYLFGPRYTSSSYADIFFIFEPAINVIINIHPLIRLGIGISYRLLSGVDTYGMDKSDIGGFGGTITLKLGSF